MDNPIRGKTFLLLAAVGLFVLGACDEGGEYCDNMCECEGCNDWQAESCEIHAAAYFDMADEYGCEEEADTAFQCALDNTDCDDNDWRLDYDDCKDEFEDIFDCVDDNSDAESGSPMLHVFGGFIGIDQPPQPGPQ